MTTDERRAHDYSKAEQRVRQLGHELTLTNKAQRLAIGAELRELAEVIEAGPRWEEA